MLTSSWPNTPRAARRPCAYTSKVGYEAAIQVECDKFQSSAWYAVLMGQSGLTMGLALYEDRKALRQIWASERDDEDNARQSVATTVT